MKKTDEVGPSKRMVEMLLRELGRDSDNPSWAEYGRLCDEISVLEKKLCDTPEMRKLLRMRDAASAKYYRGRSERDEKIRKVRRLYLSKGLTPTVRKALDGLVADLSK